MDTIEQMLSTSVVDEVTTTAHVSTAAIIGFEGALIDIECDTSNGLPGVILVGMGNKAVDEAKERVRSAINNSKLQMPKKRITLNLAPADLPKIGSSYDLPLAVAILVVSKQVPSSATKDCLFVGELALDGSLRGTRGAIGFTQIAKQHGFKRIVLPAAVAAQAAIVDGIEVIGVADLRELYRYLNGAIKLTAESPQTQHSQISYSTDMSDIAEQLLAKRALTIAAAGQHNILMHGPPGTGKTLLAKALVSILPPLNREESLESTKIHSLAGTTTDGVIDQRPFRAPHHSTSHVALIGGGRLATPGEVSLAHNGVLFLDEMPEFARQALETLRQPLEDGVVTIARAEQTARYPARFMLVATKNPCPCGYFGDQTTACSCTPAAIAQYQSRLSGPLIDRIDMSIRVERIEHKKLLSHKREGQTSAEIAKLVLAAQELQRRRQGCLNAHLSQSQLRLVEISAEARQLLNKAAERLQLSPRAYMRCLRLARTVADLEKSQFITDLHIAESLQYRGIKD